MTVDRPPPRRRPSASSVSFHRVTLAATVTSAYGAATGTVTFREGATVVGTAAVADGTATVELADVPTGAHSYTATFTPDDPTDQVGLGLRGPHGDRAGHADDHRRCRRSSTVRP